ncbi:hypothetical protein GXM_06599 [Nostoc sphaeroides CCNUC1]|uniref:Uncharacterized protein n=1 Tax=Nostoc sphaeroides CCNUC1 TaxID=2653204 RepID=A0A5P8W8M6_9NOSO|nr:hypothetical protein GXM_06599 [Nostoc sphaeroides CCNUC1]
MLYFATSPLTSYSIANAAAVPNTYSSVTFTLGYDAPKFTELPAVGARGNKLCKTLIGL